MRLQLIETFEGAHDSAPLLVVRKDRLPLMVEGATGETHTQTHTHEYTYIYTFISMIKQSCKCSNPYTTLIHTFLPCRLLF